MKTWHWLQQSKGRFVMQSRRIAKIALVLLASNASAETFDLTAATIADINKAFDSGALNSVRLVELSLASEDRRSDQILPGWSTV